MYRHTLRFALLALAAAACSKEVAPPIEDPWIVPTPPARKAPLTVTKDAGPCSPADVSSFEPVFRVSSALYQNVCTPDQIAKLSSCLATGQTPSCTTFFSTAANRKCVDCGYSDTTALPLGAVILYRGWLLDVNYADCFANAEGDFSADGCGAKMQARRECTIAACAGCSTEFQFDVPAEEACAQAAEDTVCKTYTDQSVCQFDLLNGPGKICRFPSGGFEEKYAKYIGLFCGPNPAAMTDAGSD